MKYLSLILTLLLVFSCGKNSTSSGSNVDIEWRGGQTLVYHYRSGVLIRGTWLNKFEVIDGSGDIQLKILVNGSKKETEIATVQEGLTYKVSVAVGWSNCSYSNSSTVTLSSTSASDSRKLKLDCSSVGIGGISVSETTN